MALVQLSDVIVPTIYMDYDVQNSPETLILNQSGILYTDDRLSGALSNGGVEFHVPYWTDLDTTVEPNYATDNPTDVVVPQKIGTGEWRARRADLNNAWQAADLAGILAGSDPMKRIRARTDFYWQQQFKKRLIATMAGVYTGNIAANGGDMVIDISTQDGNNATSANRFGQTSFTNAIFTMGDQFSKINAICVHSVVLANMIKAQLITYIQPANIPIQMPYYDNKLVIVDDDMPVIAGTTSGFRYVSYLFGGGVVGYADIPGQVPVEVYRRPDQGNGAGVEMLIERKSWLLQPKGFSFNSATVSSETSATLADLRLPANWTRKDYRKNIPLAFLITNG